MTSKKVILNLIIILIGICIYPSSIISTNYVSSQSVITGDISFYEDEKDDSIKNKEKIKSDLPKTGDVQLPYEIIGMFIIAFVCYKYFNREEKT